LSDNDDNDKEKTKPATIIEVEFTARPEFVTPEPLKDLIKAHRAMGPDDLLLAIHFEHPKHRNDTCLIEVIEGFDTSNIGLTDKHMFVAAFDNQSTLTGSMFKVFRLYVVNPLVLMHAIKEGWAESRAVQRAVDHDRANVLYRDRCMQSVFL